MAFVSTQPLFRSLTDEEEENFRRYARENDPPMDPEDWSVLHPVCRDEWRKLGKGPSEEV